jgi:hypothetical protein
LPTGGVRRCASRRSSGCLARKCFSAGKGNRLVLEPLGTDGLPIGFWDVTDHLMEGLAFPDPEPIGARLLDLGDDD